MSLPEIHVDRIALTRAGMEMAHKFFGRRGNGTNIEVHLSEVELAALLALAHQMGAAYQARQMILTHQLCSAGRGAPAGASVEEAPQLHARDTGSGPEPVPDHSEAGQIS